MIRKAMSNGPTKSWAMVDLDHCILPSVERKITLDFEPGSRWQGQTSLYHRTAEFTVSGVNPDSDLRRMTTLPTVFASLKEDSGIIQVQLCEQLTYLGNPAVMALCVYRGVADPYHRSRWTTGRFQMQIYFAVASDTTLLTQMLYSDDLMFTGSSASDVLASVDQYAKDFFGKARSLDWVHRTPRPVRPSTSDVEWQEEYPPHSASLVLQLFSDAMATGDLDEPDNPFGELTRAGVDEIKYVNVNSIAFLKDLPEIGGTLASYRDAVMAIAKRNPKDVAKKLASAHLSSKYGDKLTIADTKELVEAFERVKRDLNTNSSHFTLHQRSAAASSNKALQCNTEYVFTLRYNRDTGGVQGALRRLADADFLPTLSNVWDMVPYSFVVDWFVDVESFFSAYDTETYYNLISVDYAIYTSRRTYTIYASFLPQGFSDITIVEYNRSVRDQVILPTPLVSQAEGWKNNLLTGASLLANFC